MSLSPEFDPEYGSAAEWAREYRHLDLQVVPCYAPSEVAKGNAWKRPRFREWTEFQETLVADVVFDRWYGPQGQYVSRVNMGVITGRASGNLFVIDLDVHKTQAALHWWLGLLAVHNNAMALETAEQRTGGGGVQKLFRAPAGWHCPTNRTPLGVDIRGQGGFAVLAPSLHESGRSYEWLPGRAPWDDTGIAMAPQWLLDGVTALVAAHSGDNSGGKTRTASPNGDFDGFGHQRDGREWKMTRLICGAVVDWYRECPIKPSEAAQKAKATEKYLIYEGLVVSRLTDATKTKAALLEQEGRGWTLFWQKWQALMQRWDGKVAEKACKPGAKADEGPKYHDYSDEFAKASAQAKTQAKADPVGGLYERLYVRDIKALPAPNWLIKGMMIEQSMGFIFGPPGSLKTFIGLDIALTIAATLTQWWGRDVQRKGAVVYICSEGYVSLRMRIQAWEQHHGTNADGIPFCLIRQNINFMKVEDVAKLLETVQAVADETKGPIAAVFVDTVSRVLPGAEENLQKDMTLFVAACDNVRQRFGTTVVGIHHTNARGGFRGSTVMPGAGDFIVEVRREPGAMTGSIFAFKIKDDEDGWEQHFKVEKIALGDIGCHSSLVVSPSAEAPKRGEGSTWPDIHTCREILAAIDEQWRTGRPWCYGANTSRSAVKNIVKKWPIKRDVVVDILETWNARGVIAEQVYDTKNHISGYRKLVDI